MTLGFPQPSPPAAVAEGLIGASLSVAAAKLLQSPAARFAWGAYIFALLAGARGGTRST